MSFKNILGGSFIIFIVMGLSCSGSSSDPSPIPQLSFVSAEYSIEEQVIANVVIRNPNLRVEFTYQDGDRDLGVLREDLNNEIDDGKYILDQNGDFILIGSQAGMPAFSCEDYEIIRIDENQNIIPGDTVWIDRNFIVGNLIFKFLYEDQNGEFVPFDQRNFFDGVGCNPNFNFYIVDVNEEQPFEAPSSVTPRNDTSGTIVYELKQSALLFWLDVADFKLEITMYDRAGNRSNTIVTDVISK